MPVNPQVKFYEKYIEFENNLVKLSSIETVEICVSRHSQDMQKEYQFRGVLVTLTNGHKACSSYTNNHQQVEDLYASILTHIKKYSDVFKV